MSQKPPRRAKVTNLRKDIDSLKKEFCDDYKKCEEIKKIYELQQNNTFNEYIKCNILITKIQKELKLYKLYIINIYILTIFLFIYLFIK